MSSRRQSVWAAPAALVAVSAIWGGTFVMVADAIESYPMYGFLGWRFALATVAFLVFFPRSLLRMNRANLTWGLIAGVLLTAGYVFQTWGLDGATRTTPARAAFITGLYVIIVPLAQALWLKRRPRKATIFGVLMAVGGLWLLSGVGLGQLAWVTGDSMVVVAALAYSAHMLVLGGTDERHDTAALTLVQLVTVAVITSGISLTTEHAGIPTDRFVIVSIVVCGVFASALAFVVQTWAQRRMPPARAALILVLEPAFGGIFGWAVAGAWPVGEVMGAALMLGGMVTSEAVSAFVAEGERIEFEPGVEGMAAQLIEDSREPSRPFRRAIAEVVGTDPENAIDQQDGGL